MFGKKPSRYLRVNRQRYETRFVTRSRYICFARTFTSHVGSGPAPARLAHIVLELRERLKTIGSMKCETLDLPLTQEQIGEALGVTPVHANRVIAQLRKDGVVDIARGKVSIIDETALANLADFDKRYLHQSPST